MVKKIPTDKVRYVKDMLIEERQDLDDVMDSIKREELLSENINDAFEENASIADKITNFVGGWPFVYIHIVWFGAWILIPVEPFPYGLLTMVVSLEAILLSTFIMMSQNRQEARDRLRADNDYKINLKAEIEIRNLHEKLDHLLLKKWGNLIEIQEIQLELMQENMGNNDTKTEKINTIKKTNI